MKTAKNKAGINKIAILTNGGDAPGLNAVIRGIVKTAERQGIKCFGYIDGYQGLLDNIFVELTSKSGVDKLLTRGGTVIGASNSTNVFNYRQVDSEGKEQYVDLSSKCIENLKKEGFDCLFTLGGDGTQKSARDLSTLGINVIGIPKTIDNDVAHTDITFGFQTAVETATDAIDRLQTTAESHKRIMVLEVMGRYAGWIALYSAIAGGADVCLIPEIEYDLDKVAAHILEKKEKYGKKHMIVVVSEGAIEKGGELKIKIDKKRGTGLDSITLGGAGEYVANMLEEKTGIIARNTTLGYIQRGGSPVATDRILSSRYGVAAMEYALEGKFGILTTYKAGEISYVTLDDVVGKNTKIGAASGNNKESNIKRVNLDNQLINTARNLDISFGD